MKTSVRPSPRSQQQTGHDSGWETSQPEQMTGWGLSLQRSPGPEQIRAKEAITAGRVETTEAASAIGAVRIHSSSLTLAFLKTIYSIKSSFICV